MTQELLSVERLALERSLGHAVRCFELPFVASSYRVVAEVLGVFAFLLVFGFDFEELRIFVLNLIGRDELFGGVSSVVSEPNLFREVRISGASVRIVSLVLRQSCTFNFRISGESWFVIYCFFPRIMILLIIKFLVILLFNCQ